MATDFSRGVSVLGRDVVESIAWLMDNHDHDSLVNSTIEKIAELALESKEYLEKQILVWMILDGIAGSHPHPGCKNDLIDHESAEKRRMIITSIATEEQIRQVSDKILEEIAENREGEVPM